MLGAILLAGFALRVALRAVAGPASFFEGGYSFFAVNARHIASGAGYLDKFGAPATERPPLYALLLAGVRGYEDFWPALLAQAAISTGTIACAAGIALQLFGRRAALIAAALTAFYPYFAWHDTAMQETGLLTFLSALGIWLLLLARTRRSAWLALAAGAALALAMLTRPTVAPMIPFAAAWLLLGDGKTSLSYRARDAILVLVAVAALLTPWLVRQHVVTGHATMSTDTGRALYMANNPHTFDYYPAQSIDLSARVSMDAVRASGTGGYDRTASFRSQANGEVLRRLAIDYIQADPARFLVNAVYKNVAGFGLLPSPRSGSLKDWIHALSYGPILLLGLIGLWWTRADWRRESLFWIHFANFIAQTALLWAHTSHRAYLDVFLIVHAALPLARWAPSALADRWLPSAATRR